MTDSAVSPSASPPPLIEVRDLVHRYSNADFELSVPAWSCARGQHVACIGPSGSGKTTLAHIIAGILTPTEGNITVLGTDVRTLSDRSRRHWRTQQVGMVFQDGGLFDALNARDNILLPLRLRHGGMLPGDARTRATQLLQDLGIEEAARRRPTRLSGGERQRVAIARAVIGEPPLLICDEPTGTLDPVRTRGTMDLLFERANEIGSTLFVVTHDHGMLDRFDTVIDLGAEQ